jgi:hypothetical protein
MDIQANRSWDQFFETIYRKDKKGRGDRTDISLFVGAGLSIANRMPSWGKLVADLSPHRGNRALENVQQLQEGGVSLPRQISVLEAQFLEKNSRDAWSNRVRKSLYRGFLQQLTDENLDGKTILPALLKSGASNHKEMSQFFRKENRSLYEVVKMCSVKRKGIPRIASVLTINLDSLLQICDRAAHGSPRKLRTIERSSKSTETYKVPLYQLHGYLAPFKTSSRKEAADNLVLTEQEFNARTDQPYHWAATVLHRTLMESPVLFVGCSMDDELCRRALYRTRQQRIADAYAESSSRGKAAERPMHFAVCKIGSELANNYVEQSLRIIDVAPLWIADFRGKELPSRLSQVRKQLSM